MIKMIQDKSKDLLKDYVKECVSNIYVHNSVRSIEITRPFDLLEDHEKEDLAALLIEVTADEDKLDFIASSNLFDDFVSSTVNLVSANLTGRPYTNLATLMKVMAVGYYQETIDELLTDEMERRERELQFYDDAYDESIHEAA
jgi:hypothetical protein